MVPAAEFIISSVQIHPRQGYRGGGDPLLQGFVILTSDMEG